MSTERLQEIEERMTRSEELLDELEARMEKAHEYCENCDYTENDKECVKRFRTRLVALEAVLEAAMPAQREAKRIKDHTSPHFWNKPDCGNVGVSIDTRQWEQLINAVEAAKEHRA